MRPNLSSILGVSLLTAASFAQAPNLMAPAALPDQATVGVAAGMQRNAVAARGNGASLLVFEDARGGDSDIFAVRLDAAGGPIDAVPFAVTMAGGNQSAPQVVWNGQAWLVAYVSEYDPGSGYFAKQLRAQRVSAQGIVLDPTPLAIAADDTGMYFGIASDGVGWVAAWTGFTAGNSDIRARRITDAGTLLDGSGVVVQPGTYSIFFALGAAFAGGEYLFSWEQNGTRGRRFTPALVPVDPAAVALPLPAGQIVDNGAHFAAAWVRQTVSYTTEAVFQRLGANLVPVDPSPIVVSGPAAPTINEAMAVWDGGQWIASWVSQVSDARAARIANSGAVLDPGGVLLLDNASYVFYAPALAALPGGGAVHLWHETRFGSADDVFGAVFSAGGVPAPERCLSLGAELQRAVRVAAGDGAYLVTAVAERSDGSRLCAWRVDALGRGLDASPIVATTALHVRLSNGGAAWNGSCFLVVFGDAQSGQILARRLAADGTWLDASPFAVQPGYSPDVAALGGNFLVTALRSVSHPHYVFSFGARVRGGDGAVLDNPALGIGPSYAAGARVAELAGRWLVATESHASHDSNQASIALHFVDAGGVVTPATSMGILNIQNWGSVDVASSGTSALVVSQSGSNWTNSEVYVGRVLPNGTMPAPMLAITTPAPMGQSRPGVLWNGLEYVVGYHTLQNNVWFYDMGTDLYGIRIAENGAPLDALGFPLWNGPNHEVGVTGDGLGRGKGVLAATAFDPALAAMRVQVRAQRPIGLASYGTGTPGCFGAHGIDGNGAPVAGNLGFGVQVDRGPATGLAVLGVGTVGNAPGFDPGIGIRMHIDVLPPAVAVFAVVPVPPTGQVQLALPLPNQAAYYGMSLFVQGAFAWSGPCSPSPFGFSSSPGLEVRIQAP
ncbi:MAG: hypothetical protein U1E73_08510 [Planctomycetota bacterium]